MPPANSALAWPCKRKRSDAASAAEEPRANSSPARRGLGLIPRKRRRACALKDPRANASVAAERTPSSAAGGASAVAEEPRSPWASLHDDMIRLVAWRVLAGDNGVADYVRFRAVCSHWRSTTVCPRGRGVVDPRFHPRHWRMLPEGYGLYPGHGKLGKCVRFVNLRTGAFARVHLPLFKDHFAMDSVDGILFLQRDRDMAVRLLHPFTGDIVDLPSLAALTPQLVPDRGLAGSVVASLSVSPIGVITVMLACAVGYESSIAFATSEDHQWTLSSWKTKLGNTVLPFQGKIYFCTPKLELFVIDPLQQDNKGSSPTSSSLLPPKLIATCPPDKIIFLRLVECDSEILLVGWARLPYYLVYRLADIVMGRFIPLTCIGDNALLLSINRSLCVSSKIHPTIPGDCIVAIGPTSNGSLVQYNIKSGTQSIATDGDVVRGSIPSPYSLIHHIYTCCTNYCWNKGQIYCQQNQRNRHTRWPVKRRFRLGG